MRLAELEVGAARAAAGARRAADRAPLRLPPRRALARRRARSSARSSGSPSGSRTSCSSRATCSRRPSGDERLRALIERLPPVYAVLGNHDYADSRDPFSKPVGEVDLGQGDAALGRGGDARAARTPRPARRRRPALVHADGGAAVGARRPRGRPPDPALPLPARRRPPARGRVRPRRLRPHARRADLPAVRLGEGADRASEGAVQPRDLPAPLGGAARLVRARDDLRAVPVLRAARRRPSSS